MTASISRGVGPRLTSGTQSSNRRLLSFCPLLACAVPPLAGERLVQPAFLGFWTRPWIRGTVRLLVSGLPKRLLGQDGSAPMSRPTRGIPVRIVVVWAEE